MYFTTVVFVLFITIVESNRRIYDVQFTLVDEKKRVVFDYVCKLHSTFGNSYDQSGFLFFTIALVKIFLFYGSTITNLEAGAPFLQNGDFVISNFGF